MAATPTSRVRTKLLCDFEGIDSATTYTSVDINSRTATFAGAAQLSTAQKISGTASLLLASIGSSYVTVPDSDDWDFGTGDFTIDGWVRFNSISTSVVNPFVSQTIDNNDRWYCGIQTTGRMQLFFNSGGVSQCSMTTTDSVGCVVDTWYHFAFVRNGNNPYFFLDGVSQAIDVATAFGTLPNLATTLDIGRRILSVVPHYLNGWIDELRIVKGEAVWTSDFTPPTEYYLASEKYECNLRGCGVYA